MIYVYEKQKEHFIVWPENHSDNSFGSYTF